MKKYLYLLVPLIFGTLAGNNRNLLDDEYSSYYVIKDCEIYTATKENPTIPVTKIEANDNEIDDLLWLLSFCPPNTVIRANIYVRNLDAGKIHIEIVNTKTLKEYLKEMNCNPDVEPLTRTHSVSYENEKITEEVRVWREEVAQARDILRYKTYLSRTF